MNNTQRTSLVSVIMPTFNRAHLLTASVESILSQTHKALELIIVDNMLDESFAKAKEINPDPRMNPVQSLSDYYGFIDRTSELIPQDVLEDT